MADVRGAVSTPPPTDQNFFNFIGFFRKCIKYIGSAPPSKGSVPLLRQILDPPLGSPRGSPCPGVLLLRLGGLGYPCPWTEQHSEYLTRGGRYTSSAHAGGLSYLFLKCDCRHVFLDVLRIKMMPHPFSILDVLRLAHK